MKPQRLRFSSRNLIFDGDNRYNQDMTHILQNQAENTKFSKNNQPLSMVQLFVVNKTKHKYCSTRKRSIQRNSLAFPISASIPWISVGEGS